MTKGEFQRTTWDWQISLFQQKIGESVEYQLQRLVNWLNSSFSSFNPQWSFDRQLLDALKILFWVVLGLFIVWIGLKLWREFRPYFYTWWNRIEKVNTRDAKTAETQLSSSKWLKRSQEFYRQGNYREACRCLYLSTLQHLHEKEILPHKRSRTDGEYLRLLESSSNSIQPYETLITTHERLCFDDSEIFADNYEQCQQAYQQVMSNE